MSITQLISEQVGESLICLQAGAEAPEVAAGYLAAAKARLGLSRLQSVRVHHCAQVRGTA